MPFNFNPPMVYNGEESTELVLQPAIARPKLSDFFKIVEGLKGRKMVHSLKRTRKVTHRDAGCGTGKRQITLDTETVIWDPQDQKVWIYECWKTLRGKVLEWKLNVLNDKSDLTGTDVEDYLIDALTDAAFEDLLRCAWFANRTVTASMLTNGAADVENYDLFDGIWQQIFKGVQAGAIAHIDIAANEGLTTDDQTLDPGDTFPFLQQLFNSMPRELKGVPIANRRLMVTDSLMTEYLTFRESKNLDNAFDIMANGETTLKFRGHNLIVVNEWDEFIDADFKKNDRWDLPHRAILTEKDNLQLGFDAEPFDAQGENPLEVWYDINSETWNARLKYMADAQIANKKRIIVGY